jgi:hypothetical protein
MPSVSPHRPASAALKPEVKAKPRNEIEVVLGGAKSPHAADSPKGLPLIERL